MKKLVIGAGERRVEGALHHDIQPLPGIDIVCDFWDLPKATTQPGGWKFDEVYMTHVLEHFPMDKTLEVLELVRGIMKSKGKLYIEVPNFQWQARKILVDPLNRQIVEYAYGGQKNQWDFHFNGFTPDILLVDLATAGFVVINLRPNSSIECLAMKP